jgi:large subunit ribosomal protein L24
MKLKKGDKVIVIAGKDRGETGVISRVLPKENKVLVEGINIAKRHRKPTSQARSGQIVDKAMPVHVSNVMLVDGKSGKGTRIKIDRKGGERVRVAVKSGSKIA